MLGVGGSLPFEAICLHVICVFAQRLIHFAQAASSDHLHFFLLGARGAEMHPVVHTVFGSDNALLRVVRV